MDELREVVAAAEIQEAIPALRLEESRGQVCHHPALVLPELFCLSDAGSRGLLERRDAAGRAERKDGERSSPVSLITTQGTSPGLP